MPKSPSTEADWPLTILTCRKRLTHILPEIKETVAQ